MIRHLPLLLLVLLLFAVPSASASEFVPLKGDLDRKKRDIVFRAKVSRAIDNGAHWLAKQQLKDGSFKLAENTVDSMAPFYRHKFARTVLCFYTLADCGYAPDHPVIKKALGYIKKSWRSVMQGDWYAQSSSYSLSLLVLGMHAMYVQPGTVRRVVEHDRYGARKKTKKNPCGYPLWVRRMIDAVLDWAIENQTAEGLFRYPQETGRLRHPGAEDLSNTQYVLLALWAGSRCGYDISVEKLEHIARRLIAWQDKDGAKVERMPDPEPEAKPKAPTGTHGYAPQEPKPPSKPRYHDRARGFRYALVHPFSTGSMTVAGLSSLAIVKAMLMERKGLKPALKKALDQGMWDAIAWLQQRYSVHENPGEGSTWHYYYLYGLERACVIAGKRYIGANDWYREGASLLIGDQKPDGRWAPGGQASRFPGFEIYKTDLLDTCFALLFLKRATVKPKGPVLDDPGPVTTPSGK